MRARLQARVPDFNLDPDPGGKWDWLLGVLAIGVATGTLVMLTRRAVASEKPSDEVEEPAAALEYDEELHWQDRLDDELMNSDA